ncbi:MAG: hypothetical protein IKB71_04790 [Lentisphaeria bacterium]|nr:hypothetical protein [Lentisphaeria bacterium]
MKKILRLVSLLLFFSCLTVFAAPVMEQKLPPVKGNGSKNVLLFNGGRPWQGQDALNNFVNAGLRVRGLDSKYLAGQGGASIKLNVNDKVEPVPFDGITPAFKSLNKYHIAVFHLIPEKNMRNILTKERIAALKTYVQNGGHVLFTVTVPDSADELLPIKFTGSLNIQNDLFANRPDSKYFKSFPAKLPVFSYIKLATLKKGAKSVSTIKNAEGKVISHYIARWNIGKGSVTFVNAQITYPRQLKSLRNWGYSNGFLAAVAADAADFPQVDPAKLFKKMLPVVAPVQQNEVKASVSAPVLSVTEDKSAPRTGTNRAKFANGTFLSVNPDGSVNIKYPGKDRYFIRDFKIQSIACEGNQVTYDSNTNEASGSIANTVNAKVDWKYTGLSVINGNEVAINYTAAKSKMQWIFKTGSMNLDGRTFDGISERVEITEFPFFIQNVTFSGELDLPDPLFARRFSCYSPPRGYADFDMSGRKGGDTYTWNYFGSGQPFEYIVCKDALYLANVSYPQATTVKLVRRKNAPYITFSRIVNIGRCKAPQKVVGYWRWFGKGYERGHNDYLAMYQFQRQSLRKAVAINEYPSYPMVAVSAQLTKKEKESVTDHAAKLGYRYIHTSGYETPMEQTFSANSNEYNRSIAKKGIRPHLWSAGSYVQGDGSWLYNTHPEWFVKEKDGKIFAYGNGRYPVIDVNNKEFVKWYKDLVKKSIDAGVGWVYRDMDGAASRAVNYAVAESPDGTPSQIDIYKFFHKNGCLVGIEGMNPLVLDEYWYREKIYKPFAGNEFCLVGSVPSGNFADALNLDPFRCAMFGCYPVFCLAGYTFNFERIPGENERAALAVKYVREINEALDLAGMPYIRETPFGTTWYGKNGGALFFANPTKKAIIDLPAGWEIKGVKGNVLTDVPAYSVYVLKKR